MFSMDKNFKKLIKLAARHPKTMGMSVLLTFLVSAAPPISVFVFSKVIDGLTLGTMSEAKILGLVALSVGIGALGMVLTNFSVVYTERLALQIYWDIFDDSYDHIVRSNVTNDQEQDYQTAFASAKGWIDTAVNIFLGFLTGFLFQLIVATVIIGLNFGAKFVALIYVFGVIPLAVYYPIAKKMRAIMVESHESNLKINRSLSQIVENLKLINIYQTRVYEKARATMGFEEFTKNQVRETRSYARFNTLRSLLNAVLFVGLFALLIDDVFEGKFGVGMVFLFYVYMESLITQLSGLPFAYVRLKRLITRISPLLDAEDLPQTIEAGTPKYYPKIDTILLSGFQCDYLPDLDPDAVYEFEKGEVYWLKGENGAGKSTLLKAVMGLSNEASVKVEILAEGRKHELNALERGRNFAYASQEPQIWERSVEDNLGYAGHGDYGSEMRADFVSDLKTMPAYSRIEFEKTAENLSGGQTQLIHTYRAIGKNAQVLFLDEPTNSLDGDVILELIETLRTRVPDAIIVMATHSEFLQKIATKDVRLLMKEKAA